MRVTKSIREYIEKEVRDRLAPKYETEKQEAKRQDDLIDEFQDDCFKAAEKAFNDYFEKHFYKVAEFAEDKRSKDGPHFFSYVPFVTIRNCFGVPSAHTWSDRMRYEAREITNRIILELELDGNKAELMRMLDEIGKSED